MTSKVKGMICTIVSALLYGVTPVLASLTYEMGNNAVTLTFYRNMLVVPVAAAVMLARKIPFRLTKKELMLLITVGVLFRATTTFMLYESYQYAGIGVSTTLHFLYPVCTALICRILFGEKLGRGKVLALCVATAGISFFCDFSGGVRPAGVLLATASAVTYGLYMTGMDKTPLKDMDPIKVVFYMGISNAAAMLAIGLPQEKIVFVLPPLAMLYIFIVAVSTSFAAVALLQMGIRGLGAPTAAIFSMFEPIVCVLAGWLFLSEAMPANKMVGCVIIFSAVTMIAVIDKKKSDA
ncbi:MAG: DMT family transporter [Oscillospiraceae bacterium]|nr:DMT family transporter [Oscillospiraceae bacterium]